MNLTTVANNLRNTIAGKEKYLSEVYEYLDETCGASEASRTVAEVLEVNIAELQRILQDVEQCAKQASDDSWITNPDRMGGCYSEDELRNEGWK